MSDPTPGHKTRLWHKSCTVGLNSVKQMDGQCKPRAVLDCTMRCGSRNHEGGWRETSEFSLLLDFKLRQGLLCSPDWPQTYVACYLCNQAASDSQSSSQHLQSWNFRCEPPYQAWQAGFPLRLSHLPFICFLFSHSTKPKAARAERLVLPTAHSTS